MTSLFRQRLAAVLLSEAVMNADPDGQRPSGTVFLGGAGPGDPGLLTVRALELIQQATIVLHDHLVS